MKKKSAPKPTDTELAILDALWRRGPGTVREVQDALETVRPMGYTTVLKMLQIMTVKGLVERDEANRSHVYSAKLTESQTQRQLLKDLLHRAFGGSAKKLVMQALSTKKASPGELAEVRKLIDELEGGKK